jgi:two-component system phosphate regulon sensor histidine kinase PhoR
VSSIYWLMPRILLAALLAVVGSVVGHHMGAWWDQAELGAVLGSGMAVGLGAAIDALRGSRLLRWLSGTQELAAPQLAGIWGETSLRIERALRRREREALREQERLSQFLTAIEASPVGVLLLDASEQIEWCNGLAAEHLGLDAHRDLRQRITNLVRTPAFVAHLHAPHFDQPLQISGPDGRSVLSLVLRPYGEGQRLLMTQDVTARERAEATRRDFVANVSHEIRTPLTVLSGFVETMSSLPLTDVERQRVLGLMSQQTRRMQALVGDLLILARLEGSPKPAPDQWIPLIRVAGPVENDARSLSGGKHQLSFDWGDAVAVAATEAELQSAIANLVNNAVRYTPQGGKVSLQCLRRAEGGLEIRVTDTGPGIAAEHLPRLTERFYRVDGSRSRDTGGTGLGLSIVKHVIQRHGGELRISSELGRGSVFTLLLPAARVKPLGTDWTEALQSA